MLDRIGKGHPINRIDELSSGSRGRLRLPLDSRANYQTAIPINALPE